MLGFVQFNKQTNDVGPWAEVVSASQLPPSAAGYEWIPVPLPAASYSVALAKDGSPAPARILTPALTLGQLEASLLDQVDDKREALMMTVMTSGGAKKTEYAEKAGEVRDYRNTLGSILAALSTIDQRKRFPWAMAEVDQTKDTLAVVIARFEAGATASRTPAAKYAAIAQVGKRAIRTASTAAAKRAAFAAINWKA